MNRNAFDILDNWHKSLQPLVIRGARLRLVNPPWLEVLQKKTGSI